MVSYVMVFNHQCLFLLFLVSLIILCCILTSDGLKPGTVYERKPVMFFFSVWGNLSQYDLFQFCPLKNFGFPNRRIVLHSVFVLHFIIHSSFEGHSVHFHFLALLNSGHMKMTDQVSMGQNIDPLCYIQEVIEPCPLADLFLDFGNSQKFLRGAVQVYNHTKSE